MSTNENETTPGQEDKLSNFEVVKVRFDNTLTLEAKIREIATSFGAQIEGYVFGDLKVLVPKEKAKDFYDAVKQVARKLEIAIGTVTRSWSDNEREADSSYVGFDVYGIDVEDIKKAMELLHIENFYVRDGETRETIFVSPILATTEEKRKIEQQKHDQELDEKILKINNSPKVIYEGYSPSGRVTIRVERSDAEKKWGKILISFPEKIIIGPNWENPENVIDFDHSKFLTDATVRRKSARESLQGRGLKGDEIDYIIENIRKINTVIEDFKKKYIW